ncbi:hypothetical protein [Geomonas azotofigens]|uniref:hypothetical protein n=1 Tax=Geomonas azotofigens TaxID=2843196 RepID=UPI001C0FD0E7|nr:hypothetical protein [Geomonas azotofigens]MBU5611370.1 hypothetical protein [Geomonas azotofigens]
MELLAVGDSYIWYCDWCDTKNVTPWVRAKGNEVCCAACHKNYAADGKERPTRGL